MFRLTAIAALAAALFSVSAESIQAQDGVGRGLEFGYGFGIGKRHGIDRGFHGENRNFGFNRGFVSGTRFHHRIESPPYFALFPPVYYSDQIVRRPMGVSPFAAPAGIMPVEMIAQPPAAASARIVNPYFVKEAEPTKETPAAKTDT